MVGVTVALDVGGTKIAGALVDSAGQIRYDTERPTPQSEAGADPGLRATLALASDLAEQASARGWAVEAVGAGFPEYVDEAGRLTSREVMAWSEQPASLLAAAFGAVPCVVESDVRCGAVAEWKRGAAQDRSGVFYVSLGTGLSAVSIVDGQVVRGARGEAIAFGEWDVGDGNLESFASGAGIATRYATAAGERIDTREIVRRTDATALSVLTSAGRALGAAIADVVSLLDPPIVVLGGGLGTAETPLHQALRETYEQRTARRPDPPPLMTAALGGRAGFLGAALLCKLR